MQNRLVRSQREHMVAGVCGGLAQYFNIDVTIVRLIFVLLTLVGVGSTIPLYFILWLVLPLEGAQATNQPVWQANMHEMQHQAQSLVNRVKSEFQSQPQQQQEAPRFDPYTGQPVNQQAANAERKPRFDPYTGERINNDEE